MTVRPSRRRTSRSRLVLVAGLGVLIAACATPTPVTEVGLSRETPQDTYEYFKTMVRNNQWAAEWSVFSPNFKRMINAEAGRVVDVGDYSTGRQTILSNSSAEMQMLLNSQLVGEPQYLGPDRARITISGGGRSVSPTMVRMTKWELRIRGEDEPASGVVSSPGDAVMVNADGSITVRVQADPGVAAALRTVPREQIEGFAVKSEWFVDDFGGMVPQMAPQQGGTPAARPGAYPPTRTTAPQAPAPSPVRGSGSPDG